MENYGSPSNAGTEADSAEINSDVPGKELNASGNSPEDVVGNEFNTSVNSTEYV